MILQGIIQLRRDTAANWTSVNPILASGEIGYETDTNKFKFGNGTNGWTTLSYFSIGSGLTGVSSFNTRTGAVIPATNDYTWAQIDKTISNIADITTKSHTSLTDIGTNTHPTIDAFIASKNANNGLAPLDSGGKVPVANLPSALLEYLGTWNATTNTPTLADGTGIAGDVYICTTAGTVNFGSGAITFALNDWVMYNGTIWEKSINSNAVISVNGYTGVVALAKGDIGLGLVENTALSTWAGTANVTTLGTITTGIWNGTLIADSYISSASTWNAKQNALVSGTNIQSINSSSILISGNLSLEVPLTFSTGLSRTSNTITNNLLLGISGGQTIIGGTGITDILSLQGTNGNGTLTSTAIQALVGNNGATIALTVLNNGNVGVGTTIPAQQLEITQNFKLPATIGTVPYGIIYKGSTPFISDFSYGYNGTVTPVGQNTFVGVSAGNLTMGSTATQPYHGSYNTAIGNGALQNNTTGYYNTANGMNALQSNTTGNYNTANGMQALQNNTTGYYNTANGVNALYSNTTGNYNTANGMQALRNNTTGYYNTANGMQALQNNTTGYQNTANGMQALQSDTTGYQNTANGMNTLQNNITGYHNTANGVNALYDLISGSNNLAEGYNTGRGITTGSNNTILGANVTGLTNGLTNNIILATGDGTIHYQFDGTNTIIPNGNVGIGTTSIPSLLTVAGLINMKNYTVATLPAGTRGDIGYVTDALAPSFLSIVVGGGTVITPVFFNGTNWVGF